jgi:hypothetical protein
MGSGVQGEFAVDFRNKESILKVDTLDNTKRH